MITRSPGLCIFGVAHGRGGCAVKVTSRRFVFLSINRFSNILTSLLFDDFIRLSTHFVSIVDLPWRKVELFPVPSRGNRVHKLKTLMQPDPLLNKLYDKLKNALMNHYKPKRRIIA